MYVPFLSDFVDVGKNIGGAVNYGYHIPDYLTGRRSENFNFARSTFHPRGIGGAMTIMGGAPIGAAAGAAIGSQFEGNIGANAVKGAAIGAAVTAAAFPAIGLAGRGMVAGFGGVSKLFNNAIGGAINKAAASTPFTASETLSSIASAAAPVAGVISTVGSHALGLGLGFSGSLVDWKNRPSSLSAVVDRKDILGNPLEREGGVKLTALGKAVIIGSSITEGIQKAINKAETIHMGQVDNSVYTATPRTPSYAQNGGATGDLVFALNKLKRG